MFSLKCQQFRFEHPFASMIAGMTGSGKSTWVRFKLQKQFTLPRRGSFGVLQNGSLLIQKCQSPCHTLNFVKGIPTALEQDSYFDVNKRNLIVFDDQIIDASKDKRIVNLFTRGYHHCNLSVIYIVQNLFH